MSEMSQLLAEFYGTNGATKTASAPVEEGEVDLVKQAQVELFVKVATEQGIDIKNMPDDQVERLFSKFIDNTKTAADESDDEKKKKDEAAKELEEKKAEAAEFAKYDYFGRQMAHAYVDELKKIASDAKEKDKVAEFPNGFPFKKGKDEGKEEAKGKDDEKDKGKDDKGEEKKSSARLVPPTDSKSKKASAIDELAYAVALKKVAAAGWDADDAARRINAAATLNLIGESTKIASAPNLDMAVELRALELLEAARYPVEWTAA